MIEGEAVDVADVGIVYGVRPAEVFVVAHGGEGPAGKCRTGEIPTGRAAHVHLREHAGAVPGLVRVHEEHGGVSGGFGGADGPRVGAGGGANFFEHWFEI